jgi:hypothetical protein
MIKGSGRGVLFEQMVLGRHDISYLVHLNNLCPGQPPKLKWAYILSIGSVISQGDEGIHMT